MIYVNKIENGIIFNLKTGYYPKLLILEIMKLLRTMKSKINKNENDENVPHLEITEVILVHYNVVNSDYQQYSRVLYTFVPIKSFG